MMSGKIVKVCGIKDPSILSELDALGLDYIGHIFHENSPRNIEQDSSLFIVPTKAKRVGVFVNKDLDFIEKKINLFKLDTIQLHGDESPEFCEVLSKNIEVWKVFGIDEEFDFETTAPYESYCSKFLFDTKSPKHGGTGMKFNWDKLNEYRGKKPFLLSGGIGPTDLEIISKITLPQLEGVDLNSKFEIKPGVKNLEALRNFIAQFKTR